MEVLSTPVTPPFVYNYQCSSVLLTSFVPVLIMGFAIQLCFILAFPLICSLVNGRNMSLVIRNKMLPGIAWPLFWADNDDVEFPLHQKRILLIEDPRVLFNSNFVICFDVLNNVMIFLTFGLASPVLAAAVVVVAVLKMHLLLLLVGRFAAVLKDDDRNSVSQGASTESEVHYALAAMCRLPFPLVEVLQLSFWPFATVSAVFISLVCWDIACDDIGWELSLFVPMWATVYLVFLMAFNRVFRNRRNVSFGLTARSIDLDDTSQPEGCRSTDIELSVPRYSHDTVNILQLNSSSVDIKNNSKTATRNPMQVS